MLTWLFRLYWRWKRLSAEAQDIYVTPATLMSVKREQALRRGGDR